MAVIKIPKTPRRAFNRGRPPSNLIQAQIALLESAANATTTEPGARKRRSVRTEGEAADYIQQLTLDLHPRTESPPPPERRTKRKMRRKPKSRAKKAARRNAPRANPKTRRLAGRKK